MPLYEYACDACDAEFELLVRGSEQPSCPSCRSKQLQRRISVPAAHTSSRGGGLPVCQPPSVPT